MIVISYIYYEMVRKKTIEVLESISYLRNRIKQEKNGKNVIRLQSLVSIKEEKFEKQSDLAKHLGYHVRTMELWLKKYKEGGLKKMLQDKSKKQERRRKISASVSEGLRKRLTDPFGGFNSYVQALEWVKEEYGEDYNYGTLRQYMIDKYGTKIKQPRKSHVKSSEQAQVAFLKVYPKKC